MTRNKLVHVIESASGGSLQYVIQLCGLLDPKEWQITVIHSRRSDTPEDLASCFPAHVQLIELSMTREISPGRDGRAIRRLRHLLKTLQPDLVHLHSSKAGVIGRAAAWRLPLNVIYTPHGFSFFRLDVSVWKRRFFWLIEKTIDWLFPARFLVGSREEERQALRFAARNRVAFLPNSVHVPDGPSPLMSGSTPCYVTVGRITAAKNPALMLDVAEGVQKRCPQARFIWIGDGEEREWLQREAQRRGVQAEVTGWLPRDAVRALMEQSSCYVQASRWEGLPLSLLEAMAATRPVVVSDIAAHRDVIRHGREGYIGGQAQELAGFICDLLAQPELAQTIGFQAWNTVRTEYSHEHFCAEVVAYYHQLLDR